MTAIQALIQLQESLSSNGPFGTPGVSAAVGETLRQDLAQIDSLFDESQELGREDTDRLGEMVAALRNAAVLGSQNVELPSGRNYVGALARGLSLVFEDGYCVLLSPQLSIALDLINRQWRTRYFGYLLRALHSRWIALRLREPANAKLMESFLLNKVDGYEGRNPLLVSVRAHPELFIAQNGPDVLGTSLADRGVAPESSLKEFCYPVTQFGSEYSLELVAVYLTSVQSFSDSQVNTLRTFCGRTPVPDAKRVLVSHCILTARRLGYQETDVLRDFALREIGDPQMVSKWTIGDDSLGRFRETVARARVELNGWINADIITLFFQLISGSRDRKEFWLRYRRQFSSISLVAKSEERRRLEHRDRRIQEFLKGRFIEADSGTPALVFEKDGRVFVEFSEHGNAFYAYLDSHANAKLAKKTWIRSTTLLKDTSMPTLGPRSQQGRFTHVDRVRGDWEQVLGGWLRNIAGMQGDKN